MYNFSLIMVNRMHYDPNTDSENYLVYNVVREGNCHLTPNDKKLCFNSAKLQQKNLIMSTIFALNFGTLNQFLWLLFFRN